MAGRKKMNLKTIYISITEDQYNKLQKLKDEKMCSFSYLIREALQKYLKNQKIQ
jgi:predicted CopG family antitoxin